jgi:hypothetical protein
MSFKSTGRPRNVGGPENRINLACTAEEKVAVLTVQKVRKVPFIIDLFREMSLSQIMAEYRELKALFADQDAPEAEEEEPVGSPSEG